MLFLIFFQFSRVLSQLTNIEESFIDGLSENQGWTMTADSQIVNEQACDQVNHTSFFTPQSGVVKLLELPPHNKIEISFQVVMVGAQNDEKNHVRGWLDQDYIEQKSNETISNCKLYQMSFSPLIHYAETALIVIQGNGNDSQLWGIRNFMVNVQKCPNSCSRCDQIEQCGQWEVVVNETYDISTDSLNPIIKYKEFNEPLIITQQHLEPNYKSWISLLYISFQDDDQLTLKIDNDTKNYKIQGVSSLMVKNQKLHIQRIEYQYDSPLTNQSVIQILSGQQQYGIRDLIIFIAKNESKESSNSDKQEQENLNLINNSQILQQSLIQAQTEADYCELINEYDLYDNQDDSQEDYFSNQYIVKNGLTGRVITSIFNGGYIIGGYHIFDQNSKVQKYFQHIKNLVYLYVYTFSIQLYIFGEPSPSDEVFIKFKDQNGKLLNEDGNYQHKLSEIKGEKKFNSVLNTYYYNIKIQKKQNYFRNQPDNIMILSEIEYSSKYYRFDGIILLYQSFLGI